MKDRLPKFASPPVVEAVLSAQFARLPRFSNAHAGWFWKGYLGPEWPEAKEVPRLSDQFERFGEERRFKGPDAGISIATSPVAQRLQITNSSGDRMIQVQDSRFVYNWQRKPGSDSPYPSYESLLPEFHSNFRPFEKFAAELGSDSLDLNQWEVTYVNDLRKGNLWDSPGDWVNIFPDFHWLHAEPQARPDGFRGEWQFVIGGNQGRLYVSLTHARIGGESGPETLLLQLTARGPINAREGIGLDKGFETGHEAIVRSFTAMTSTACHNHWERKQ